MKVFGISFLIFALFSCAVFAEKSENVKSSDNFIVGGNEAKPGQFPFLVSLRRVIERTHFCGGAIVNKKWTLSAAHCITATRITEPSQFVNVVGTLSRTSSDGFWHETIQYILHPKWVEYLARYDIVLIQVTKDFQFGPLVMPVGFSPERINDSGMIGTIAGFGRTNTEPRPDELLYIESTSMTNAECRRFYSRNQNPFNAVRIFDSNICFTNPVGEGICGGDSGSSIVMNNISIGVASWGTAICGSGDPDSYARTSFFYDWIMETARID